MEQSAPAAGLIVNLVPLLVLVFLYYAAVNVARRARGRGPGTVPPGGTIPLPVRDLVRGQGRPAEDTTLAILLRMAALLGAAIFVFTLAAAVVLRYLGILYMYPFELFEAFAPVVVAVLLWGAETAGADLVRRTDAIRDRILELRLARDLPVGLAGLGLLCAAAAAWRMRGRRA